MQELECVILEVAHAGEGLYFESKDDQERVHGFFVLWHFIIRVGG